MGILTATPVTVPDFTEVGSYVTGHGVELGRDDFISFAAYCQAHPDGSWARMLQVIVGETEPQPSAEHERCANCHRWVYRVTSESGTNVGWLHEHTDTATGQQNNACGYAGEIGAVGKPASAVLTDAQVWEIIGNHISTGAPTPISVRLERNGAGRAPNVTVQCERGRIGDVIAWGEIFGITGRGRARRSVAECPGDGAYYVLSPSISLMRAHDVSVMMLPGWELHVRAELDDYEMATWSQR